jgi:hypothetical protein
MYGLGLKLASCTLFWDLRSKKLIASVGRVRGRGFRVRLVGNCAIMLPNP